jgi:ubiquinone/menaquinone biosynthesis C-methylase UbiE
MESQAEARARREQEFHDARFADSDGRRRSSAFYEIARPSQLRFAEWIEEVPAGSRVLELGCGPDSVAWDLWDRGVEVTGIDISPAAIDMARSKATQRGVDPDRFRVGNVEHVDFDDDSFDVVIGSAILHHVELVPALAGVQRVLKPGGLGLFHEPLGRNPAINLYRWLTPSERTADEHPLTKVDLEAIQELFGTAHLEYFHLTSLAALPLLGTRVFASVHNLLEKTDRWLMGRVPTLASYAWVVLIRAQNSKHS